MSNSKLFIFDDCEHINNILKFFIGVLSDDFILTLEEHDLNKITSLITKYKSYDKGRDNYVKAVNTIKEREQFLKNEKELHKKQITDSIFCEKRNIIDQN